MKNKAFLLSLQRGIVKELKFKGLLTEEQTKQAINEFEQLYEKSIINEEMNKQ